MKNTLSSKLSFPSLLFQIVVSALIMLIFSAYLWLIQLNYDNSVAGYKRALLFSLIIFGGGFSYDCAKKILFLKQEIFKKFVASFFESTVQLIAISLLAIASITFASLGLTLAGQVLYVLTLGWTLFVVSSLIKTIEIASDN